MSSSSGRGRGKGRGRGRGRGANAQNNNYIEPARPGRAQHVEPLKPVENQIPEVKPPSSVEERPTLQQKSASLTNGIPNQAEKPKMPVVRPKRQPAQVLATTGSTLPSSQVAARSSALVLPRRPGFGTKGKRINLATNFFEIKFKDHDIFQYDVTIEPKCPTALNRMIIQTLVKEYSKIFQQDKPVFDGKKNVYTIRQLPFGTDKKELEVTISDEEEKRERQFKVTIKLVSRVSLLDLRNAVNGKCPVPYDVIHAVDVALRHLPSLKYVPVGRSFFSEPEGLRPYELGLGREVWFGYHQSVRPSQWKAMINIDVSATAFYKSQPVLEFINEIMERRGFVEGRRELSDAERVKLSKEIKGLKVQVTHLGKQKRKYRVIGVSKEAVSRKTFTKENTDGTKVSVTVAQYFKDQYGITLRYPLLPCLQVGNPSKGCFLPMEVCNIVAGQRCIKKLNERQTSDMIKCTARNANDRKKEIMNVLGKANFAEDEHLKYFGIEVSTEMTKVVGRVLDAPKIEYGREVLVSPSKGSWNLQNHTLNIPQKIEKWAVVVFATHKDCGERQLSHFLQMFVNKGKELGIDIDDNPCFCKYYRGGNNRHERNHHNEGNDLENIFMEACHKSIELIIAVLPGKTQYYAQLKQLGDTKYGIPTQCVQVKNVTRPNHQTLANLYLKINTKLGGVNSYIGKGSRPRILDKPVIFFGADVTHPSPGDDQSPSIAAVVGSIDGHPMNYRPAIRTQKHRQEVIEDLQAMTKELLIAFYKSTRQKPEKIIMYRDGVSEGQFQTVLQCELAAIQQACLSLEKDYKPGITFIVVQKRHHAKFFAESDRDKVGKSGNIPAGTTVDQVICHPTEYDFYLCSHAGIQGTSKPAHYHVLWDDNNIGADELQQLTYMLCHTYVRCTRSVSIPAPAYYAHLVAFRARYYMEQQRESSASSSTGSGSKSKPQIDESTLKKWSEECKAHENISNKMYFA